ncbi:glucose 1-dehydrogenase [Streptomyces sp. PA5.6]|uniref:glucose 1-dehydrogenase n=1 Tax=Streptomyces sp. PA5.6 TaxID=3035651 RepID=UPI0039047186
MPLLTGKVALITGAASGIGAATAAVFAAHGAAVSLADINTEEGNRVAAAVTAKGGHALFTRADVRSAEDVAALLQATVERFSRLDCAVNNAGIDGQPAPVHQSTQENWHEVVDTNLTGVWLCMRSEIAQMLVQGAGSIVNTASVGGLVGTPAGMSAYTAAKHGVIGLTRSAGLEYARQSIRVNALCPGVVRTPMVEAAVRQGLLSEEQLLAHQPIGRFAEPEEIAEAAAWLCSDSSSVVTGHALAVDGGWTAQ